MKKVIKGFFALMIGAILLTGCQNNSGATAESTSVAASSSTSESKVETIKTTIKIEKDGAESDSKELEVAEGTNLLDALKENFDVETSDEGFITAIDGTAQDDSKGYYWTFTINGDWGEKGAADTILNNNDEIVFSYGKV